MLANNLRRLMMGAASATILMSPALATAGTTNINLAVASNFYGIPPNNSAITDIITSFEAENQTQSYTVTVVDNGATATLEAHIIAGNTLGVDLFLAADTATPEDLLVNHFNLVTTYNNSTTPPVAYSVVPGDTTCGKVALTRRAAPPRKTASGTRQDASSPRY